LLWGIGGALGFAIGTGFASAPGSAHAKTWVHNRATREPLRFVHRLKFATVALPGSEDSVHTATRVHIVKHSHLMELYEGDQVFARYRVAIGAGGLGNKRQAADRITPVGTYHVTRHDPSQHHMFLTLDFPNDTDRLRFAHMKARRELSPGAVLGGTVGIHGGTREDWVTADRIVDWTSGSVAVKDWEIDQIESWVPDGTEVDIED
jgi:murein L,D-transpeptidase YafK